jgi:hypothetical protein
LFLLHLSHSQYSTIGASYQKRFIYVHHQNGCSLIGGHFQGLFFFILTGKKPSCSDCPVVGCDIIANCWTVVFYFVIYFCNCFHEVWRNPMMQYTCTLQFILMLLLILRWIYNYVLLMLFKYEVYSKWSIYI